MAIYRLPFPKSRSWNEGTGGNWDAGHHGVEQSHNPTDEQAYAFDFDIEDGTKILCARAGTVEDAGNDPPGAGNYIWIRHADGTLAAYLHMQDGSLRVELGQWVPQGYWIGDCGSTGHSSDPHLHFDVHTYGERGHLHAPELGTHLLIHFEDQSRTSFRPVNGERVAEKSNNVEGDYRQDHWRHCVKCHGLYFAGNPGSSCPRGGRHEYRGGGNYTLSVGATDPKGQRGWRYCKKCRGLFFSGRPSRCPKGPGSEHDGSISGDYALLDNVRPPAGHQNGWRWCRNCGGLWFKASRSRCPASRGGHVEEGSGDYSLHHSAEDWQRNWRSCEKCGGLFFAENISKSKCRGNGGGPHVVANFQLNYFLSLNSPDAPGQSGWRWCRNCQCLWMGLNSGSDCHAGGEHASAGSGEYTVIHEAENDGPGQKNWRWCHKCQGLWFADSPGKTCPESGVHSESGSGRYRVQRDAFNEVVALPWP